MASAFDLARGVAPGTSLRAAALAGHIATLARLSPDQSLAAGHIALLRCSGFSATAPTVAAELGDDLAAGAQLRAVDVRDVAALASAASRLGSGAIERAWSAGAVRTVLRLRETVGAEVASLLAAAIGLPAAVVSGLSFAFERWDGRGHPGVASGPAIPVPVRVAVLADALAVLGVPAGLAYATEHAGAIFEPALVAGVLGVSSSLAPPHYDPPTLAPTAYPAIGALADMRSLHTRGYSAAVARRAVSAAESCGIDPDQVWPGALLSGLGRFGVPASHPAAYLGYAPPPWVPARAVDLVRAALAFCARVPPNGLPPWAVAAVASAAPQAPSPRAAGLSPRSGLALSVIARGASVDDVARSLRTSPRKAATAVREAMATLGVSTPEGAVFAASAAGLVAPPGA